MRDKNEFDDIVYKQGKAEVPLEVPIKIKNEGREIDVISLRRPTFRDSEIMEKLGEGFEASKRMISQLAGIPPEAVSDIDLYDITRIQTVIEGFIGHGAKYFEG